MNNTKCLFKEGTSTKGMVSVSQLQTFMSCPKKWEYGYVENLTPRVERPYLSVGKLCHKGMQMAMLSIYENDMHMHPPMLYDNAKRDGIAAMEKEWEFYLNSFTFLEEEIPELEQRLEDAKKVFDQAFDEFEPQKYEVMYLWQNGKRIPALELHFIVPCAGSKGLHGYIDAILKEKESGFIWCTDYKFRKSLSPDDEEAVNIQNAVYIYACDKLKLSPTGTMTWQHCNTPASDPAILKNGQVSRAKIKTTWKHFEEFCRDNDIDPEPYEEEMKGKLSEIEWFRATREYRNNRTIKQMWEEIIVPASYAVKSAHTKAKNGKRNPRHMYPWNCKMCQFKDLCLAELRDYDVDHIKEMDFVTREG